MAIELKPERKPFDVWFAKVNSAVEAETGGLSVNDLPDCCFRDWFDDGVKPEAAAKRALKNASE